MKSTSGEHFIALDHVRALAAMLVFCWHFMHALRGYPVPFEGTPFWGPLVLFDEGHVGVALFMTLSGYLFARLLAGRSIIFRLFLVNRLLRLLPLLLVVMFINVVVEGVRHNSVNAALQYAMTLPRGLILPTWPNGGWSIAVELHFYLLLPLLLFLQRRLYQALWLTLVIAIICRTGYHALTGEVQSLAYATIFGRIDQFVLGILAYHHRDQLAGRHVRLAWIAVAFLTAYWWFDKQGGFFLQPSYPSPSPVWIVLPTVEGLAWGSMIAWYDGSFRHGTGWVSRLFVALGQYSYSIYLLHFFVVFAVADWIHRNVIDLSSLYVALPVSILFFVAMAPIGYLSMHLIEKPFLKLRKRYTVPSP